MLDFAAQTRFALAWSDLTTGIMRQAMATSVANMHAMAGGMLSMAEPALVGASWQRDRRSTAMPWHRAPEQRAFNPAWWLEPPTLPAASSILNPFALWQAPVSPAGWGLNMWQTPMPAGHGASAAVPGLLTLVAMGMAAQQALALLEATQGWQTAANSSRYALPPLPNYRSDGGHAVATIVMDTPMAAASLPISGLALMLQLFDAMQPRSKVAHR